MTPSPQNFWVKCTQISVGHAVLGRPTLTFQMSLITRMITAKALTLEFLLYCSETYVYKIAKEKPPKYLLSKFSFFNSIYQQSTTPSPIF
jgi:hypothetical protein